MRNEPIMKENKPRILTKIAGWLVIISMSASAIANILLGRAIRPWAFFIVLMGLVLFTISKYSMIKKKTVSFGTQDMSENMANLYRLGYGLMVVGLIATFY